MWARIVDILAHKTRDEVDGEAAPQSMLSTDQANNNNNANSNATGGGQLNNSIQKYTKLFDDETKGDYEKIQSRQQDYETLVKEYYNVSR
jgi:hypothetical protein